MSRKQLLCALPELLLCAVLVTPARAGVIAILNPDGSYLAATHLMSVTGDEFDSVTSVSDGINGATFFISPIQTPSALTIYDAGSGWATWSFPPDSETATPRILGTTPQLEMQLAFPVLVFGFEAEPNGFGTATMTADFYGGGIFRGSVTRTVSGDGGARLFAAYSGLGIDDVVVNGSDQFGVAQLRYGNDGSTIVPEPGSGSLAAAAVVGAWLFMRIRVVVSRRRR